MIVMAPMPVLDLQSTEKLIYRGEGNSSLVIALQSKRKVIRLLKSDAKKLKNDDDVLSHLLQHIDFNVNILPDIISNVFFSPPQLICLDPVQIERIKNLVKDKRPSFRLDKTISDCEYALLMPDYCCIPKSISSLIPTIGPVLAIEIKPKQGFLPDLDLFKTDPELNIKSNVCRFGLAQFYKLQKQSIRNISSYCPLDLFSGCPYRSLYSLVCLIENPQNNFRLFCDAELVYGEQFYGKSASVENLKRILERFLAFDMQSPYSKAANGNLYLACHNRLKQFKSKDQNANLNHQSETASDAIDSFCLLLLQSLYTSYSEQKNDLPNIYQNGNRHDYSRVSNVLREFTKLNSSDEYVFLRTFIQMFESASSDYTSSNDINNNNNNNIVTQLSETINDNDNVSLPLTPESFHTPQPNLNGNAVTFDTNNNHSSNNNSHVIVSDVDNDKHTTKVLYPDSKACENGHKQTIASNGSIHSTCALHRGKQAKKLKSRLNFSCACREPSHHALPSGCVLDAILLAQMLDSIDSAVAVQTFDKLSARYNDLKQYMFQSFVPASELSEESFENFLRMFLLQNLHDLDILWRFLISLTAKDCSIMIAMQRVDPLASNASLLSNPGSPVVITDKVTGHRFVISVSITDLDYKQAYKIQRMLYNDRRMINAYKSALNKSQSSLIPGELANTECDSL